MHNPASALENDSQTDHLILARRPDITIIIIIIIIINWYNCHKRERICKMVDLSVPADPRIKLKECEKKDKYHDLARELIKTMEHEGDNCTNRDWCFWYSNQKII